MSAAVLFDKKIADDLEASDRIRNRPSLKFVQNDDGYPLMENQVSVRGKEGEASLDTLPTIDLGELEEKAALLKRTDRKYLVSPEDVAELVGYLGIHGARVLNIDGSIRFAYESYYFDTPDYDLYMAATTSRRRRYKLRLRVYADSGMSFLELKTKSGRGQTVKDRFLLGDVADLPERDEGLLVRDDVSAWLTSSMVRRGVARDNAQAATKVEALICVGRTEYLRSTLRTPEDSRVTIDRDLVLAAPDGCGEMRVSDIVVETKSAGKISQADKWLWRRGIRPTRISKYAVGIAVRNRDLPSHRWHMTMKKLGKVEGETQRER